MKRDEDRAFYEMRRRAQMRTNWFWVVFMVACMEWFFILVLLGDWLKSLIGP